jgi:hypothetical protein
VFRVNPPGFEKIDVRPRTVKATETRADFQFRMQQAASALRYELQGAAVFVSLEDVQESVGFRQRYSFSTDREDQMLSGMAQQEQWAKEKGYIQSVFGMDELRRLLESR